MRGVIPPITPTAVLLYLTAIGVAVTVAPAPSQADGIHAVGAMHHRLGWFDGWVHFPIGAVLLLIALAGLIVFIRSLIHTRRPRAGDSEPPKLRPDRWKH